MAGSSLERIPKTDSTDDAWASTGYNYINPFVHQIRMSRVQWTKIYILTVILLPIRFVGVVFTLILTWMLACIGLCGISKEQLRAKPLVGWRKFFQYLVSKSMRLCYACGSFQYITFKGKQVSPKEAPILVIAPHSSYIDSMVVVATGPSCIVAKEETAAVPIFGKIVTIAQPIYVQRGDPNSRQNTIQEIVNRSRSNDKWPQVSIFAEGTCTNRSALIKFKAGAFIPGKPVQPVLLKYPNNYDTTTWTWNGPSIWRLLWLTLAQFHTRCELEFLPVYIPNCEEKADADLYAHNVRNVMAKALGVPTSAYCFEDVTIMGRAKTMHIPFPGDIIEIESIVDRTGLLKSNTDTEIATNFTSITNANNLDIISFSERIKVDIKNPLFHRLFVILDHRHIGYISLKTFLLCSLFCKLANEERIQFLRAIVPIYSESNRRIIRKEFQDIVKHAGSLTEKKWDAVFFAIDEANKGYITFEDFEQYTKDKREYEFLYKKPEHIRRGYEEKPNRCIRLQK